MQKVRCDEQIHDVVLLIFNVLIGSWTLFHVISRALNSGLNLNQHWQPSLRLQVDSELEVDSDSEGAVSS
jgi:hypothetical protein